MCSVTACCWGHTGNTVPVLTPPWKGELREQHSCRITLLWPAHCKGLAQSGCPLTGQSKLNKWSGEKGQNALMGCDRMRDGDSARKWHYYARCLRLTGIYWTLLSLRKIWKAQTVLFQHTAFFLLKHMVFCCCKDSYMNWGKFVFCTANRVFGVVKAGTENGPSAVGSACCCQQCPLLVIRKDGCLAVSFNSSPHLCFAS